MFIIFTSLVLITAFLHCFFFKLESIDFIKKNTLKRFGLNDEQGKTVKTWAFNQGFYNLFLALGLFYSLYLLHGGMFESGKILARFILIFITAAGIVLLSSAPKKYPAALIQALPALLAFTMSFLF